LKNSPVRRFCPYKIGTSAIPGDASQKKQLAKDGIPALNSILQEPAPRHWGKSVNGPSRPFLIVFLPRDHFHENVFDNHSHLR
jgi:hypothetical protein